MISSLETSLFFYGRAGDIDSLKNLARSENRRSEQWQDRLALVLSKSGPISFTEEEFMSVGKKYDIFWSSSSEGVYTLSVSEKINAS